MNVVIPYKPRNWSLALHNAKTRWVVMVLHRRAGKTTAVLNHLQRDCLRVPESQFAYIGPTYKQSKRVAWDIAIIPVVLTLAGQLGLSGRDTLEAIVIGLEVHSRTADVNGVPMGLYCVGAALGTTAVAARVMGLAHEETKNALGMALSTASVAELNMGSDAHIFESAMQCLQAIMAVEAEGPQLPAM